MVHTAYTANGAVRNVGHKVNDASAGFFQRTGELVETVRLPKLSRYCWRNAAEIVCRQFVRAFHQPFNRGQYCASVTFASAARTWSATISQLERLCCMSKLISVLRVSNGHRRGNHSTTAATWRICIPSWGQDSRPTSNGHLIDNQNCTPVGGNVGTLVIIVVTVKRAGSGNETIYGARTPAAVAPVR